MNRFLHGRSPTAIRAGLMLLVLLMAASVPVLAQDGAETTDDLEDAVDFQVEMFRVDLYRNDAGEEVERLVEVSDAVRGQEIEYRITATNEGDRIYRAFEFLATMQVPEGLVYLEGSAGEPEGPYTVELSTDGGDTFVEAGEADVDPAEVDVIQWVYGERFEPGDEITFSYRVTVE